MSSKNADPAIAPRTYSCSIGTRLAIFYTISGVGMLAAATGFLYWVLVHNLVVEDIELLEDKMTVMRLILKQRPGDTESLKAEVEWEGSSRRFERYYARLLDESGQVVLETPGMAEILPPNLPFPAPAAVSQAPTGALQWRSPEGRFFLLAAAWAEMGTPNRGRRLHQVALDLSNEKALLANYRRKLAVVLLFGVLLSAGVGVVLTRQGLRPLAQITRAVQRITAAQLSERISPQRWPSELTTLAIEFDKMLGRLEESFTRLSQFSADLAHELRTPINNLMGEAEVALSRSRSNADYRQVLESSLEEFQRLSRMIDSLLFLARSDNAEMRLERAPIAVLKEIEAVAEFYEAVAAEQGVAISCAGDGTLHADVILFRRALSNLVSNAFRYTPRGGHIAIRSRTLTDGGIEIEVTDTGCGMAAEHLPRVFDRFYRVDPARAHCEQGTGLGLAIVKSIVELHGGSIVIRSAPGSGTTVTLRFPGLGVKTSDDILVT